jgi:hypothetical protein
MSKEAGGTITQFTCISSVVLLSHPAFQKFIPINAIYVKGKEEWSIDKDRTQNTTDIPMQTIQVSLVQGIPIQELRKKIANSEFRNSVSNITAVEKENELGSTLKILLQPFPKKGVPTPGIAYTMPYDFPEKFLKPPRLPNFMIVVKGDLSSYRGGMSSITGKVYKDPFGRNVFVAGKIVDLN